MGGKFGDQFYPINTQGPNSNKCLSKKNKLTTLLFLLRRKIHFSNKNPVISVSRIFVVFSDAWPLVFKIVRALLLICFFFSFFSLIFVLPVREFSFHFVFFKEKKKRKREMKFFKCVVEKSSIY